MTVTVGAQSGTITAGTAGSVTYEITLGYNISTSYACYSIALSQSAYSPSAPAGVTAQWLGYPTGSSPYSTNPYFGYLSPAVSPGSMTGVSLQLTTTSATPAGSYTFKVNLTGSYFGPIFNPDYSSADVTLLVGGASCTNPTSGGTIAAAQTICNNTTPNPLTSSTLPSGHTGTLEYKWQKSTTGSSSGFVDIDGATDTGYSPEAITQTTWYKRLSKVTCSGTWPAAGESNVVEITVRPAGSSSIVVINNNNSGSGSLRQAISDACDGDSIIFNLSTGNETIILTSEIAITKALTINGTNTSGSGTDVTVQVTSPKVSAWRVFEINAVGKTVSVQNMKIKGGDVWPASVTFAESEYGGAIRLMAGNLTLENVTVSDSKAVFGGAMYTKGTTTLRNCTFHDNLGDRGGAVFSKNVDVAVINSTFTNNQATFSGGALCPSGGTTHVINSTITGNNASSMGGGICGHSNETFYVANTILQNNTDTWGGPNFRNATLYSFYSWIGPGTGSPIYQTTAPSINTSYTAGDIGALASNGGPTQTMAVLSGKPPFQTGGFVYYNPGDGYYLQGTNNNYYKLIGYTLFSPVSPASDKILTDQRGATRYSSTNIGAYDGDHTPATQASNVLFSSIGTDRMTISWTRGDGDSCAVFVKKTLTGTASPVNNSMYYTSTVFGNGDQIGATGWYCVFRGTGTSVAVTGLEMGETYRAHVCEFNHGSIYYNSSSGTGNPANQATNSCANPTLGGIIATAQTICHGSTPAGLTSTSLPSGHTGTLEYKWQSSITNSSSGFADIGSATGTTYDPGALTQTTWFKRLSKVTCDGTWPVAGESNVIQVMVRSEFTSGEIATTGETICYNTSPATAISNTTPASGGDGSINYSWRSSADGYATDILSATGTTYTPAGPLTATTSYRRYAKDGTCNTTPTVSTGTWTVTIMPEFTTGAINTTGETICYNGNPSQIGSATAASGGDNVISYQWQSSTTSGITGFADIGSATGSTYDPPTGLTATTWYRRMAKDGTCNATFTASTGVWQVTVRDNFTAGAIETTGETICYNGDPTLIGSATDAGGGDEVISYQWQQIAGVIDAPLWTDVTGATNSTYNPPALTSSTTYRRLAKDGTCNTTFTASTGVWGVTVRPEFTSGAIATTGENICYNTNPATTIGNTTSGSGGDNAITYSWRSSADSYATEISGATGSTYLPAGPLTETTSYRRYVNDGTCNTTPTASSGTWTVTVSPLSAGGAVTGGTDVCYGTNSTLLTLSGHTGSVVKWQYSTDNTIWTDISSHTQTTYTAENLTVDTWYRAVVESSPCSAVNSDATQITIMTGFAISGYAKYENNPKTPLNGLKITLKKDGSPIGAPVTTGNNGYYEFTGLEHGNYGIEISSAHPSGQWQTWGGVNNTDYLLVARHIAGTQFLPVNPPVVQVAASTKLPHPTINSADALAIRQAAKYPTTGYSYFDIPKWVFSGTETTTPLDNIEVVCNNVTRNIRGLCAGDVNGTYVPPTGYKTAVETHGRASLQLVHRGTLPLTDEIIFPIRVDRNMELGAITLLLDFNPSAIMITGVEMPQNGGVDPWYSVNGGMIHIGWWTMDPVAVTESDVLLWIHAKQINDQSTGDQVRFTLNELPLSELATGAGEVIHDAVLVMPAAGSTASAIAEFIVAVFPNPAKETVHIHYQMTSEEMVSFELLNSQGITVLKTARQLKDAGTHMESFDVKGLLPGVYMIQATAGQHVSVRKLVVAK